MLCGVSFLRMVCPLLPTELNNITPIAWHYLFFCPKQNPTNRWKSPNSGYCWRVQQWEHLRGRSKWNGTRVNKTGAIMWLMQMDETDWAVFAQVHALIFSGPQRVPNGPQRVPNSPQQVPGRPPAGGGGAQLLPRRHSSRYPEPGVAGLRTLSSIRGCWFPLLNPGYRDLQKRAI